MPRTSKSAFTLIEILVSLAIVAVLSTVVVVTLNPAELVKQARDSNRISDLNTINTALGTFSADVVGGSVGVSSTVYVSLPSNNSDCSDLGLPTLTGGWVYKCTTSENLAKIDGTGWIPANLQRISFGNPLEKLPIDPKNSTSTGLYYTFVTTGSWWELTAILESEKYGPRMVVDGGASPNAFEQGTNLTLTPTEALDRGVPPSETTPTITSISPATAYSGDPGFTLTVIGTNFTSSSVVRWGGSDKTTTFASSTQLTASILAADVSATGTIAVTVYDITNGTSGGSNFAVDERIQFIAGNWTTDSSGGATQSYGSTIVEAGGNLYILAGGTTFQKYNPNSKIWTNLMAIPAATNAGVAFVKYDSNTLYAFPGGGDKKFYKYTIDNNAWTQMADAPAIPGAGASLAYPGSGDYIYAIRGDSYYSDFWRYSVANDSWGESGKRQWAGAILAEANGKYYVFPGSSDFQEYNPSTKKWRSLATLPIEPDHGAALVKYNSNTLYAFSGNLSANFYKYTIDIDTWEPMTSALANPSTGAALTYPGTGDYIYALRGAGTSVFWKYSINGNSWSAASSTPGGVGAGGSLTSIGSSKIYALRGGGGVDFWEYDIPSGIWSSKKNVPAMINGGGPLLTSDGTYVYCLRGMATKTLWRYDPSGNSWSSLADAPENMIQANTNSTIGGLAYSSSINKIYALSGISDGIAGSIFEYDVGSNRWAFSPHTPGYVGAGGSMTSLNSNKLYAMQGINTNGFWEYDISTATWTAKTNTLATVYGGGSLLTSDGTNLYAFRGTNTATFWKYIPVINSWSTLSDAPVTIALSNININFGGIAYLSALNSIYGISGKSGSIYKNSP